MGYSDDPPTGRWREILAALSTINDLIYVYDEDCRFVYANQSMVNLLGVEIDDLLGRHVREVIRDDVVADRLESATRHVVETGETVVSTTDYVSPTGVAGSYEYILRRYEHETGFWVIGSSRDVSERIQLASQLAEANEHLRSILESTTDAFYSLDPQWRFTYVNRQAAAFLRRDAETLLGKVIWEEFPNTRDTLLRDRFARAIDEQVPISFELYYEPLAGWFDVHAFPTGEFLSVFFRDVTEKRRIQEEREESQRQLAEAQRIARMGSWKLDLRTGTVTCSAEHDRIFGLDPQPDPRKLADYEHAVHPDDLHMLHEQLDRIVAQRNGSYDVEYRITRSDGQQRTIHTLAELVTDGEGVPVSVVGTTHDITERKEIEKALEDYAVQQSMLSREVQQLNATLEQQVEIRTAELRRLSHDLEQMVRERTAELEESRAELAHQAQHDALTDLPNRTLFEDRLAHAIASADRNNTMVAVLFVDLDGFKLVNDSLGHGVGDDVLQTIARRLAARVRRSDTLARHGGDEFMAIIEGLTSPEEAYSVAHDCLKAVNRPITMAGRSIRLSASIGVAMYPHDAETVAGLQSHADVAMYQAKLSGKNDIRFFSPSMNVATDERLEIAAHLTSALEQQELDVYFQPQWGTASGRIESFEALLRWNNPHLGSVSPARLIPIAEEVGVITEIGSWVLDQSCAEAARWNNLGREPIGISVNVSPAQFERQDFADFVARTLEIHGLSPSRLELEITETSAMSDLQTTVDRMTELRDLGVRIVMDDFALGSSSLGNLVRIPLDTVKIDRRFIRDLSESNVADRVVQAIAALARGIGLEVVAEGVETEAQRLRVIELGCGRVQGFYLGYPAPRDVTYDLLCEHIGIRR